MGKNLYVSLASYVKPQISTLKVLVLGGMVLFFLVSALALPQMMLNSGFMLQMFGNAGAGKTWLTLMSCLIGPVMVVNALALVSFAFYSLYRWITEKDLLAGLRMSPSQVGEDSLVATEKLLAGMVESALADLNETAQPAEPPTAEPAAPTQPEPLY